MTATPTDLSKYADGQLRALSLEVVNELLRRGVSIEEICKRSGAATTEDLWTLGIRPAPSVSLEVSPDMAMYARWVRADLVCDIECRDFVGVLRHPAWKGLRVDLDCEMVHLPA